MFQLRFNQILRLFKMQEAVLLKPISNQILSYLPLLILLLGDVQEERPNLVGVVSDSA